MVARIINREFPNLATQVGKQMLRGVAKLSQKSHRCGWLSSYKSDSTIMFYLGFEGQEEGPWF